MTPILLRADQEGERLDQRHPEKENASAAFQSGGGIAAIVRKAVLSFDSGPQPEPSGCSPGRRRSG